MNQASASGVGMQALERSRTIPLRKIQLFQNLEGAELRAIQNLLVEKKLLKGDLLFHEGYSCQRIFVVTSGKVKLYRSAVDGRERILEILGPGDSCVCHPGLDDWCCHASAAAMSDATVLYLPAQDYRRCIQSNSKLTMTLSKIFAQRLRAFSALATEVSIKDAKQKLVRLLLTLARDQGIPVKHGTLILTDFTREDLANRIGTARETVVRCLYQLKKVKLIKLKSRHHITLLDKAGLDKLL